MNRPSSLANLDTQEWDRLQDLLDRFEEAWKESLDPAAPVLLSEFLPPPEDRLRSVVLQELVKADLEIRWRRGAALQMELEEYLTRFPELGTPANVATPLIYEEYRARQMFGDRPPLDAYCQRFPSQFADLNRLVLVQPVPTVTDLISDPSYTLIVPADVPPAAGKEFLTVGGGYELIKRIGAGSFGEVWRAEAPGGIEVAVKIIYRPLDHKEAQRELRALELIKRLRHPFLLQTQAYFPAPDKILIVMELADGNLRDRWNECRRQGEKGIPPRELLTYLRESAEALDFLHAENVLHRDIKPDNILLLKRHAKVADFGLARLQSSQQSVLTSGGGTPAYMAPEVWRGKVGERSDQYSLAVAYAELRLGRQIFPGRGALARFSEPADEALDLDPLPIAEQQLLRRALDGDPDRRFASCLEFAGMLEAALAPLLPAKKPSGAFTPAPLAPPLAARVESTVDTAPPTPARVEQSAPAPASTAARDAHSAPTPTPTAPVASPPPAAPRGGLAAPVWRTSADAVVTQQLARQRGLVVGAWVVLGLVAVAGVLGYLLSFLTAK